MHNLFLGSEKHLLTIWKDNDLITKKIQEPIERMKVPVDIGRLPYKIESGMASLTAEQWKNWTCIYSLYVSYDILPMEHLKCWHLFVQACNIISLPIIRDAQINQADELLVRFCKACEELYGPECCTNLHCHLAECLRDYGPATSIWCFSFERYTGILGKTLINNHSLDIEKTMATRFIQQMETKKSFSNFADDLEEFFPTVTAGTVNDGQIGPSMY